MICNKISLENIAEKGSSSLMQKDLKLGSGDYPIYGASGLLGYVDFYHQENESIGIVKDGAGVGRVFLLPAKASCIGTMQYIIPKAGVDAHFLFYALENMNLSRYNTGATIPHIYFRDYKGEKIPEYRLDEQKKIAKTLDKLRGNIEKRKKQLQKFDDLVKSQFIEMFGVLETNSKSWAVVPLSEIAEYFNGLTYKPENVTSDGMIVLRSSNIQDSELDFDDIVRVNCRLKEKLYVKDGDILMCSRNGSAKLVGKVAQIGKLPEPATFGAFMMIIRTEYPKYLLTYFKMPVFREQIKVGATTTINQITSAMLDKIRLPLPPKSLVEEFSRFVEQTDKSKVLMEQARKLVQILIKLILNIGTIEKSIQICYNGHRKEGV